MRDFANEEKQALVKELSDEGKLDKSKQPKVFDPSDEVEPEPPKTRRARKAEKVLNEEINKHLHAYFMFRSKVKDPKGEEMADKFEELDISWRRYCNKWKHSPKRMKNSDEVYPMVGAFSNRVEQFTKQVEAQEKANLEISSQPGVIQEKPKTANKKKRKKKKTVTKKSK